MLYRFITLLILLLAAPAWGANEFYCVAPSGEKESGENNTSDQGAGCYGSIAAVLAANGFNGDDQVVQINGTDTTSSGSKTYTETITWTSKGGTEGHPLVIRGRTGDTITISSGETWLWTNNSDNITYQNLTFTGTTGSVASMYVAGTHSRVTFVNCKFNGGAGYGWYGGGVTGLSISDCQFNNNTYSGLGMVSASTGTIADSVFQGNAWNGINGLLSGLAISGTRSGLTSTCDISANAGHGFWHQGGTVAMSVTGCVSHENCDDYPTCADGHRLHGFVVGGHTANVSNFTFEKNYAYKSDIAFDLQSNTGYTNSDGSIINNILVNDLYNASLLGVGLYFSGAAVGGNSNITVEQNTIISTASNAGAVAVWVGVSGGTGNVFKNNIMSQTGGGYAFYNESTTYTTSDYNLYWTSKATPFYDQGESLSFADWKTASSQDAHSPTPSDPLLNASYGLAGNSPAKDAGAVLYTYAAHPGDFIGAKVYGSAPDIGAIEYKDHTFGGWFFEMFIPTIFNLCASTNANCYTQP